MKIYVYKVIIFITAIFFLYQFTIGRTISNYQTKFYSSLDKETVNKLKNKVREEIQGALKKDRILNKEDAQLINKILNKLRIEINSYN